MANRFSSDDSPDRAASSRNRVLHAVDPSELEEAADILRERTMTLERDDDVLPAKWLIGSIVAVAGGIAAVTVMFSRELRMLIGLS